MVECVGQLRRVTRNRCEVDNQAHVLPEQRREIN